MPHFYGLVLADNHRQCLLYGDHIRLSLDGGNEQRTNWPSKRFLILKLYLGIFCRALNGKGWSSWWRQSGGTFGSAFLAPASVSVHQSSNQPPATPCNLHEAHRQRIRNGQRHTQLCFSN